MGLPAGLGRQFVITALLAFLGGTVTSFGFRQLMLSQAAQRRLDAERAPNQDEQRLSAAEPDYSAFPCLARTHRGAGGVFALPFVAAASRESALDVITRVAEQAGRGRLSADVAWLRATRALIECEVLAIQAEARVVAEENRVYAHRSASGGFEHDAFACLIDVTGQLMVIRKGDDAVLDSAAAALAEALDARARLAADLESLARSLVANE